MPMFTAPIALGYLGLTIFHEQVGAVNTVLRSLWGMHTCPPGSPPSGWRASPSSWWTSGSGRRSVSWCCWPALQSLPDEIYEAAALDTSSGWDMFRFITLPLLSPILFTVTILRLVEAFKILDIPFSMTNGGPGAATQTYSFYVYLTGLRNFNQGYASALAYHPADRHDDDRHVLLQPHAAELRLRSCDMYTCASNPPLGRMPCCG